jgi:hypothetical protein
MIPSFLLAVTLHANDFCAGSPLTIGAPYHHEVVTDIHTVDNAHGRPVGWIYTMSSGSSYLQANRRMSAEDQRALHVTALGGPSEPRIRPERLPVDLDVQPCKASQVRVY